MHLKQSILVTSALALASTHATAQNTGPSTSTPPYLIPNPALPAGSVSTTSILTAGDTIGGYRMCGVPDGLGAWPGANNTIQLVVNHEFARTEGIARAHGATGAFVSRWTIDAATLAVLSGRDHNHAPDDVHAFDRSTSTWLTGSDPFERFCSGDLAPQSAYYFNGLGSDTRIYLCGEETRPPSTPTYGRVFAQILDGALANQSFELPGLGGLSFENAVASPFAQLKTIVMLDDDSDRSTVYNPPTNPAPSELYMYVGAKRSSGSPIVRAGLVGGNVFGPVVRVNGAIVLTESDAFGFGTAATGFIGSADFSMRRLGDASTFDGVQLQATSVRRDVFRMARVEDGAWDPRPGFANDYYFVTTASVTTNSRLWRVHFFDILNPELGGKIEILVSGSEGHKMFDNICVDPLGRVVLCEDVGGDPRLGKVWLYHPTTDTLTEVAAHSAQYFDPSGSNFLTNNEEASGVVPVFSLLGAGWYLIDTQAHFAFGDPEIVEGGQLLALYIDPAL